MAKIAIIPARGGSKRIPKKNTRSFHGSPIIKYSIDAALAAGCFDEVMVSTDDVAIATIAIECGAAIPFLRSERNSGDKATTADVVLEVLGEYSKLGKEFEYLCCIYPAAPLIDADKIKSGFDHMIKANADSLLPIVKFSYPVQRALKVESDRVRMSDPAYHKARSQDLPPRYHDAGQFYWCKTKIFMEEQRLIGSNAAFIELSEMDSQDIDNESDWRLAGMKYALKRGS
jgi:pseudaminic acid cytidylyltransferase